MSFERFLPAGMYTFFGKRQIPNALPLFPNFREFISTERAFAVLENAAQTVRKSLFDVSSFRVDNVSADRVVARSTFVRNTICLLC